MATRSSQPAATLVPAMALGLASNFGSVEQWRAEVAALSFAHAATGGRVCLAFDPNSGALSNRWAPDADAGDTLIPLLAIALPTALPIEPDHFFAALDWPLAYQRYQDAVHAASERFAAHDTAGSLVLDVRRASVFEAATTMLPGAVWHDPANVGAWAGGSDRPPGACLLRLRPRSRPRHRDALAGARRERALPRRRHRRMAARGPRHGREAGSVVIDLRRKLG